MTGFTDVSAAAILDQLVLDYPYLGLFNAVGDDAGGFTEVTGGNYSRVDHSGIWAAASGSAPVTKTSTIVLDLPLPSDLWGTSIAVGLFSLIAGGVLGFWDFLGNYTWQPTFITTPGVLTAKGHGISIGHNLVYSTEVGGTAPTFFTSTLTGLLTAASVTIDTLTVTNSFTPVQTSTTGSGLIRKVTPMIIQAGAPVSFAAGALTLRAA